jgi:glucose-6-phosphate isomerase
MGELMDEVKRITEKQQTNTLQNQLDVSKAVIRGYERRLAEADRAMVKYETTIEGIQRFLSFLDKALKEEK